MDHSEPLGLVFDMPFYASSGAFVKVERLGLTAILSSGGAK